MRTVWGHKSEGRWKRGRGRRWNKEKGVKNRLIAGGTAFVLIMYWQFSCCSVIPNDAYSYTICIALGVVGKLKVT